MIINNSYLIFSFVRVDVHGFDLAENIIMYTDLYQQKIKRIQKDLDILFTVY